MSQPSSGRRRTRSSSRSTGPGAAARAAGAKRRGPAARSDRPGSRPDGAVSATGKAVAAGGRERPKARHAAPAAPRERRPGMWRQFAVLGVVLIAVALAVAVPLRGYLHQRAELSNALAEQQELEKQVAELEQRKAALQDPNYVKAEARRRLQYVTPGETVYRIVAPKVAEAPKSGAAAADQPADSEPWYGQMWDTLTEDVPKK